jgi:hypothetical protein
VPTTTGRLYCEMLAYMPLTNNAVLRKIPIKKKRKQMVKEQQ